MQPTEISATCSEKHSCWILSGLTKPSLHSEHKEPLLCKPSFHPLLVVISSCKQGLQIRTREVAGSGPSSQEYLFYFG